MSKVLTLEEILKSKSRMAQSKLVELDGWGGTVRICPMSPGAADAYNTSINEGRVFSGQVPVVFECMLEPAFESLKQVEDLGFALVGEAFSAITELGKDKTDEGDNKGSSVDEAEKNSDAMSD